MRAREAAEAQTGLQFSGAGGASAEIALDFADLAAVGFFRERHLAALQAGAVIVSMALSHLVSERARGSGARESE